MIDYPFQNAKVRIVFQVTKFFFLDATVAHLSSSYAGAILQEVASAQ